MVESLKRVVTVTTASQGVEVELTRRPRNCRLLIVERVEANTYEVRCLEDPPRPQHEVQVEAVLLPTQVGSVTLELVHE